MATSARISKAGARVAKAYELFLGLHIKHVDNEYYAEPFYLEGWQRKNIWNPILGCGAMQGTRFIRKFRRAMIGLPRDGGKSETAAGLLLTIANMEPVYNGEYGVIASSKKQAAKTFGKIKSMILQDPDLSAAWEVLTATCVHRETGAQLMVFPYSEALAQGFHFNVCIIEELHVHKSTAVLDAVISGQKSITNALTVVITTAGKKREGALWDTLNLWRDDPNSYVYWLGAKDTDAIDDRKVWAKVKPMSFISMDDMEDQFASTSRRSFERYTLNRFPLNNDADHALTYHQVSRCAKQKSQFDPDKPFVIGIDGATSGDSFGIICVQRNGAHLDFREWVLDEPPEETGTYDLVQVEALLVEQHANHRPLIAIDPNRLVLLAQHLEQTYGIELVGVRQDWPSMSTATALMVNAVKSGAARLGGCPKLTAHLRNARLAENLSGQTRFTSTGKGAAKERIDAAIAGAIGLYALETQGDTTSVYETRGILTI